MIREFPTKTVRTTRIQPAVHTQHAASWWLCWMIDAGGLMRTRFLSLLLVGWSSTALSATSGTVSGQVIGLDCRADPYARAGAAGAVGRRQFFAQTGPMPLQEIMVRIDVLSADAEPTTRFGRTNAAGLFEIDWSTAADMEAVVVTVVAKRPDIAATEVLSREPASQFELGGPLGVADVATLATAGFPLPRGDVTATTQADTTLTECNEITDAFYTLREVYTLFDSQGDPFIGGSIRSDMLGLHLSLNNPGFGGGTPTASSIFLGAGTAAARPETVAHEVGHAVAWRALDQDIALINGTTDYNICVPDPNNLTWQDFSLECDKAAFHEGLATAIAAFWMWREEAPAPFWPPDGSAPGGLPPSLEAPGLCDDIPGTRFTAPFCNTRAVWDLYDNPPFDDDDVVSRDLSDIVGVLRSYQRSCLNPYDNNCANEGAWIGAGIVDSDGNNWKDFRANWQFALGSTETPPAEVVGVCEEGEPVDQGGDPGLALAIFASTDPECDSDDQCDGRICDTEIHRCIATFFDVATGGMVTRLGAQPTSLSVRAETDGTTLTFSDLVGSFGPANVFGAFVSSMSISLREAVSAVLQSDGTFSIPKGDAHFTLSAHLAIVDGIEGDVSFNADNETALEGVYDEASARFTIRGTIRDESDLGEGRFQFNMHFVNRPPAAYAGEDRTVECNASGGASLALDGDATDPDGTEDIRRSTWAVGGSFVGYDPATVTLPLGSHEATLTVVDRSGSFDTDDVDIAVVDMTPPTLAEFAVNGPLCLSPPNHKYVVLRVGEEFSGLVTDTCDPNAALTVTGATSSQPDDAEGDGATGNDVVVFRDRVCLRTERQGGETVDRVYTVHLAAVDASGNASDPVVQIRVAHDQRDRDCPHLDAVLFADDGDELCVPVPATMRGDPTLSDTTHASGCAATSGATLAPFALAVLLLRRPRQRRCSR